MRRAFGLSALAIGAALAIAARAGADTLEERFAAANEAYFRGDVGAAAQGYERLVELGVRDADVFYNLGTAYARQGQYGRAIAAFERALRVRPGDADARAALDRSRALVARSRADREGEAVVESGSPLVEVIFGGMSTDGLAVAVLLFDLLFFGVLMALRLVRHDRVRLGLGIAAPLLGLGLAFVVLGLSVRSGLFEEGTPAIVVREGASVREGPRPDARERHRAREGERASVSERDSGWAKLRLPGNRAGWIEEKDLVLLE
jgi:tetratricopeptide (TPR) repeat protein